MSLETINGLWMGGRLSLLEQLTIKSFMHHGHPFRLYTYEKVKGAPKGCEIASGPSILKKSARVAYSSGPGKGSPSLFSNLFRYQLLYSLGGWWVDMDVVCLRPFKFKHEFVIGNQGGRMKGVNGAVIRAPKGCPTMRYCLKTATKKMTGRVNWGDLGPRLLSQAVQKTGRAKFVHKPVAFYPLNYSRWQNLFKPVTLFDRSYAVHLWHEFWRRAKRDKNKTYHPDSLLEQLKRTYL